MAITKRVSKQVTNIVWFCLLGMSRQEIRLGCGGGGFRRHRQRASGATERAQDSHRSRLLVCVFGSAR